MPDRIDRHLRWLFPLLLVVLGLVLHWPAGAGFKADDYVAIRYAAESNNVLHDFAGSQYGLSFFLFYRPLITLSFGVDHLLFGTSPFGFYLMNMLAAVAAALLLYSLLRLLAPPSTASIFAFVVAVLWLSHPFLVPSLRWVAGRVDTHVAPPLLLALLLHLRTRRGGERWPVWVAALCALGTKESAIGFPLLALGLDLLDPHPSLRPGPTLFGRALPALRYLWLVPGFFAFRWVVLGQPLGGYGFMAQAAIDPLAILEGLRHNVAETLKPGLVGLGGKMPPVLVALALVFWILHRKAERGPRALGAVLVAAGLFGPLAQILPSMRSGDQRFAYLAGAGALVVWAALATGLARGIRPLALALGLVPLVWLLPAQAAQRGVMAGHDEFNRELLTAIRHCEERLAQWDPIVIGGEAERVNDPYRFLWGLGSVRKPPFTTTRREVLTLRKAHPLAQPAGSLVTEGLPVSVAVIDGRPRLVARAARARHEQAAPVGFDGILWRADLDRVAKDEAFGFAVGAGFEGEVTVCTTVGSCVVKPPLENVGEGLLSVPRLLFANVTHRVEGPPLWLLHVVWNAMDLAKDSPLRLYWREKDRTVTATLYFTPEFTRAVRDALTPE